MIKESPQFSLFKKLDISQKGAKKIAYLQDSFENFSKHLMRMCRDNEESKQGMMRLQESCVWFSRSLAMMSAYDMERKRQDKNKPQDIPDDEIIEEDNDNVGNIISNEVFVDNSYIEPKTKRKKPVIKVKKKKIIQQ